MNPEAGSARKTAEGPSVTMVEVNDVTNSLSTSISCRERLRTSAAKEMPTASGGSHKDCSMRACGIWLKAVQEVQLLTTRSMAFSMSKAKRYRLVTI